LKSRLTGEKNIMAEAAPPTALRYRARTTEDPKDLRILDPASVTICRRDGGYPDLILRGEACYPRIRVVRCFPLSGRFVYISLRNSDDQEIGLIENLTFLDENSSRIVREELDKRYFLSEIKDIHSISNQYGFIIFDVHTNRGPRTFNVRDRHRNIVDMGRGRVLVIDTDGCQYEIPDCRRLSHHSRRQLFKIL